MRRDAGTRSDDPSILAAYVILTHSDPAQTERLVRAIRSSSPQAVVFVAHDGRSVGPPRGIDDPRTRVWEHGLPTDWGSWEIVEATLRSFEYVRARWDPDLVVLISGRDYPTRRLAEWEAEVVATASWVGSAEALHYVPHWGRRRGEGRDELTRYSHRWFQTPFARRGIRLAGPFGIWLRRVRGAIALRAEPIFSVRFVTRGRGVFWGIRRPTPFTPERPCYSGSQWLALTRPALDRLLDHDLRRGSRLRRFYRSTIIPDESALVSPLSWWSPPAELPPVTHVRWDSDLDQPITHLLRDLDEITGSGSPFCRKVDPVDSADLMDELDRRTRTA